MSDVPRTSALDSSEALPTGARAENALGLGLFSLVSITVFAPQVLLAFEALQSPQVRGLIAGAPLFAAELAIAVGFWLALLIWPLSRLARSLKNCADFRLATEIFAVELPRRRATRLNAAEHFERAGKSTHSGGLDAPEALPARRHGARDAGSSKDGQDWVTRIEWIEQPRRKATASF